MTMLLIIILLLFTAIIVLDFLPVYKSQPKRDNFIYCGVLSAGFIILFIFSINKNFAGLSGCIKDFIKVFTGKLR